MRGRTVLVACIMLLLVPLSSFGQYVGAGEPVPWPEAKITGWDMWSVPRMKELKEAINDDIRRDNAAAIHRWRNVNAILDEDREAAAQAYTDNRRVLEESIAINDARHVDVVEMLEAVPELKAILDGALASLPAGTSIKALIDGLLSDEREETDQQFGGLATTVAEALALAQKTEAAMLEAKGAWTALDDTQKARLAEAVSSVKLSLATQLAAAAADGLTEAEIGKIATDTITTLKAEGKIDSETAIMLLAKTGPGLAALIATILLGLQQKWKPSRSQNETNALAIAVRDLQSSAGMLTLRTGLAPARAEPIAAAPGTAPTG